MPTRTLVARVILPHPKGPAHGVLIVRKHPLKGRNTGKFNLPGGKAGVKVITDSSKNHTLHAEAPHETAKRETREEVGITPSQLREFTRINITKREPHGIEREHHVVFIGKSNKKPKPNNEIRDVAYYHPKKGKKLKLTGHATKVVKLFYSTLRKN